MTNSEKIKTLLNTGHKVKLVGAHNTSTNIEEYLIFTSRQDGFEAKYIHDKKNECIRYIDGTWINQMNCNIFTYQEPLRYPNVGDKVVISGEYKNYLGDFSNKVVQVTKVGSDCTVVSIYDGVCFGIDYRYLIPCL